MLVGSQSDRSPATAANHTSPPASLAWSRSDFFLLAALVVATFIVYFPSLDYAFVYDDRLLILKNPEILSWRFLPHYFVKDFISLAIPEAPAVYYRPVLLVWMLANAKLWGMSPPGWHFTAIALHVVVVAEVYLLARRLLSDRFMGAVAAGVFALHPVHVECVAWVMAEAEQLTASLVLWSLLAWLRLRENPSRRGAWWTLTLGLFVLAVLIKENAIMLPVLIAAYEWFCGPARRKGSAQAADSPLARLWTRARASLIAAAPFFAVAFVYLAVRLSVLKGLGHPATPMALFTFAATVPLVAYRYLRLLLFPVGLSVCYDVPYVHRLSFQDFFLPAATVGLFAALLVAWARKHRVWAFASAWMGLTILPVLDLPVFFRSETVHDRYLYLPSVGFALLVGILFGWFRDRAASRHGRMLVPYAAAGLLMVLLGAGSWYARGFWKDNWTLFQRAVRIAPHNVVGLNNLGNEYVDRGRYDEALALYRRVLDEYPPYWESAYNAGYCLYKQGRLEEALEYFKRAYNTEPYDADVCIYYGLTYLKLGRSDLAEPLVRQAIALRPDGQGFHFALGMILREKGALPEALKEFQTELANHPNEAEAARQVQEIESRLRAQPH